MRSDIALGGVFPDYSLPDHTRTVRTLRAAVGAQWTFISDPGRTIQRDLDIREYTDSEHDPMIPHALVLKPGAGDSQYLQRVLVLGTPVVLGAMARPPRCLE
jgi:hypothetical protein